MQDNDDPRENPPKPKAKLVEGDYGIYVVNSQAMPMANVNDWMVDSQATMHLCRGWRKASLPR